MKNKKIIILLTVIVFLVQAACAVGGTTATTQAPPPVENVGNQAATGIALTQATQQVVEAPPDTPEPLEVLPTSTPEVPTFTTVLSVQGSVNYGANCRTDPGANFRNVVVLNQGTLVDVIGTSKATDNSTWWQVSNAVQADCWLIDAALTISGDKSSVVKVVSPPTPTPVPAPTWGGAWTIWMGQTSLEEIVSINFVQNGNELTTRFYAFGTGINFVGTVSEDGMAVYGSVRPDTISVPFPAVFKRNPSNLNQFLGSYNWPGMTEVDAPWCGAKGGAAKPDPCKSH